jgi:transposase-like protein
MVISRPKKRLASTPRRIRPPFVWTAKADAVLGTMTDAAIAAQLQILPESVAMRRRKLGIAPFNTAVVWVEWTKEMDALLGTAPDPVIAAQLQIRTGSVGNRRRKLGIAQFGSGPIKWTAKVDALLGTAPDATIAAKLRCIPETVGERRHKLRIARFSTAALTWTKQREALLGTDTDPAIAKKLGLSPGQVRLRRQSLGIPAAKPHPEALKKIIARSGALPVPSQSRAITSTGRQFLIDQPHVQRARTEFSDTEDMALTAYLERELAEVYSKSLHPPSCPYCRSRRTILQQKPHGCHPLPRFACRTCKQNFNRVAGTPLFRLRAAKLPLFIRLLSQQIPYNVAARRLGVSIDAIQNWAKKFRIWLLQLDPTGKWEKKVRLGIKARPHIRCPRCGVDGEKHFVGYMPTGERRLSCPACGTAFGMSDAECLAQETVRLEVCHDPGKVDLDPEARTS